jgi:exopolysaccharide production protein ExoZ
VVKAPRQVEVDILKAMAIIAILIGHLRQYLSIEATTLSTSVASTFTYFGLSLFIFVSGYSLMINKPTFNGLNDLKRYLAKRVSRIYPLYWLVLVLLLVFDALPRSDLLGNIILFTGFQILVYPVLVQNTLYWFVSAIVVFYLMFPVILYAAQRMHSAFERSVLIVSVILFAGLVSINLLFGTIDISIFLYFWLFVSGIVLGNRIRIADIKRSQAMYAIAAIGLGILAVGLVKVFIFPGGGLHFTDPFVTIALFLAMAISILIAIQFANVFKRFVRDRTSVLVTTIAASTYSIYLFTGPVLGALTSVVSNMDENIIRVIVIVIGIPLAFIVSIYAQKMVDQLFRYRARS